MLFGFMGGKLNKQGQVILCCPVGYFIIKEGQVVCFCKNITFSLPTQENYAIRVLIPIRLAMIPKRCNSFYAINRNAIRLAPINCFIGLLKADKVEILH